MRTHRVMFFSGEATMNMAERAPSGEGTPNNCLNIQLVETFSKLMPLAGLSPMIDLLRFRFITFSL